MSDGAEAYAWSAADRLTARGADTFSYDALDRLIASTVGGVTRTSAYDGDGLLASRTTPVPTTFLWDPATSPARLVQVGTDRIVYGLGPLYVAKVDGTTTTLARDGGKNVRAEVNDLGIVTGSYRYRAYGETAQSSGSGPTHLGYAGQLTDPSGLLYMRARWYDPATRRFLTRDPISGSVMLPTTLNAYGYGGANPALLSDPSGLAFIAEDPSGACDLSCETAPGLERSSSGEQRPLEGYQACWVDLVNCNPVGVAAPRLATVVTVRGPSVMILAASDENRATGGVGPGGGGPGGFPRKFTKDQQALIDLARNAKRTGVTTREAETLLEWADEYGVYARGPEIHLKRRVVNWWHIQIDRQDHIRIWGR